MNKFKSLMVSAALAGMVTAAPLSAASATRSAQALPAVAAASAGQVFYTPGAENTWSCTQIDDDSLALEDEYVRVNEAGQVVVDAQGAPFRCRPPASAYQAGSGGFPWEVMLGILAAAGLAIGLGGGGGSDSPG